MTKEKITCSGCIKLMLLWDIKPWCHNTVYCPIGKKRVKPTSVACKNKITFKPILKVR